MKPGLALSACGPERPQAAQGRSAHCGRREPAVVCVGWSEQRPMRAAVSTSNACPRACGARVPCDARSRGPAAELAARPYRPLRSDTRRESEHVARCARGPRALRFSAAHRRAAGRPHGPLRHHRASAPVACHRGACRARGPSPGAISGSASSAASGRDARLQSARTPLTRGRCLSGASAARAASSAALARTEQRSAVGTAGADRPSMSPWRGPPGATLGRRRRFWHGRKRMSVQGRKRSLGRFAFHAPRVERCAVEN